MNPSALSRALGAALPGCASLLVAAALPLVAQQPPATSPSNPAIRYYVTALHHQDRDLGPTPWTEVSPRPLRARRSPIWHYVTPLHPKVRDFGPEPYTEIAIQPSPSPTLRAAKESPEP